MIHVIKGPPCAGKSTYIREHAAEGDLRVDFDLLAECLGNTKRHDAEGLIKEAAFKAREGAISEALKHPDLESWIIHTAPTAAQMQAYEAAGAEIIELDVSREECLRRAEADDRPQATFDAINKYFAEEKSMANKHLYKSFELKADELGTISGYFSTYDKTPDSYGDIVAPGAFTETIKKRAETGHPFPLCFNHDFSAVIGAVDHIEDTEKGPYIEAHFLDTQLAQDVRKMLMSGAIYQFSFAYDILGARQPDADEKKAGVAQVLTELEVFEISVVTVPANQNAVATEVKAIEPEIKSGRRNSKADEDVIASTIDQLDKCINALKSLINEDDEPEDRPEDEAPAEPTDEANAAAEEQKAAENAKRAEALREKIKNMKEG